MFKTARRGKRWMKLNFHFIYLGSVSLEREWKWIFGYHDESSGAMNLDPTTFSPLLIIYRRAFTVVVKLVFGWMIYRIE